MPLPSPVEFGERMAEECEADPASAPIGMDTEGRHPADSRTAPGLRPDRGTCRRSGPRRRPGTTGWGRRDKHASATAASRRTADGDSRSGGRMRRPRGDRRPARRRRPPCGSGCPTEAWLRGWFVVEIDLHRPEDALEPPARSLEDGLKAWIRRDHVGMEGNPQVRCGQRHRVPSASFGPCQERFGETGVQQMRPNAEVDEGRHVLRPVGVVLHQGRGRARGVEDEAGVVLGNEAWRVVALAHDVRVTSGVPYSAIEASAISS